MLLPFHLAAPDPVAARHIAFEDQAFSISVVMGFVQLCNKLLGLGQNFFVTCWPQRPVNLGR